MEDALSDWQLGEIDQEDMYVSWLHIKASNQACPDNSVSAVVSSHTLSLSPCLLPDRLPGHLQTDLHRGLRHFAHLPHNRYRGLHGLQVGLGIYFRCSKSHSDRNRFTKLTVPPPHPQPHPIPITTQNRTSQKFINNT